MTPWLQESGDDVLLDVIVVPKSSRTRVVGVFDGRLRVQIAATPTDNQANDALIKFLAKTLGIAKSRVNIVAGGTSKRKTVRIDAIKPMLVRFKLPV